MQMVLLEAFQTIFLMKASRDAKYKIDLDYAGVTFTSAIPDAQTAWNNVVQGASLQACSIPLHSSINISSLFLKYYTQTASKGNYPVSIDTM